MICVILFLLAAVCDACCDTLAHHFSSSVFSRLDERFWNPEVSWKYVGFLPLTSYRYDAWHLLKSARILLCLTAVVSFHPLTVFSLTLPGWVEFLCIGFLWNIVFGLFYNKILLK